MHISICIYDTTYMNDVRVHNFKEGEVDSTIILRCENGLVAVVKNRTEIIIVIIVIIQQTSRL